MSHSSISGPHGSIEEIGSVHRRVKRGSSSGSSRHHSNRHHLLPPHQRSFISPHNREGIDVLTDTNQDSDPDDGGAFVHSPLDADVQTSTLSTGNGKQAYVESDTSSYSHRTRKSSANRIMGALDPQNSLFFGTPITIDKSRSGQTQEVQRWRDESQEDDVNLVTHDDNPVPPSYTMRSRHRRSRGLELAMDPGGVANLVTDDDNPVPPSYTTRSRHRISRGLELAMEPGGVALPNPDGPTPEFPNIGNGFGNTAGSSYTSQNIQPHTDFQYPRERPERRRGKHRDNEPRLDIIDEDKRTKETESSPDNPKDPRYQSYRNLIAPPQPLSAPLQAFSRSLVPEFHNPFDPRHIERKWGSSRNKNKPVAQRDDPESTGDFVLDELRDAQRDFDKVFNKAPEYYRGERRTVAETFHEGSNREGLQRDSAEHKDHRDSMPRPLPQYEISSREILAKRFNHGRRINHQA